MAHPSRAAARRHRRKLATGWIPPDPFPPVDLLRHGKTVTIERSAESPRRDLFVYDASNNILDLTALAKWQGYRLP